MRRLSLLLPALSLALGFFHPVLAQETPGALELRELRQAVQQQGKQIELLTEQIGRLTRTLDGQKAPEFSVPTAPANSGDPLRPSADAVPEVPKAEAVAKTETASSAGKHVVAKGETLTSIAKQYSIPIAELKNTNKIENERKLQIGQILTVPTAKTPETSEKKENP